MDLRIVGWCVWMGLCGAIVGCAATSSVCERDVDCASGSVCQSKRCVVGGQEQPSEKNDGGSKETEAEPRPEGCATGEKRPCYEGTEGTQNKGRCKAGDQACTNGAWGACVGAVPPSKEVCGNQEDENCDGVLDDGCERCKAGEKRICYTGAPDTRKKGACADGVETCQSNGFWGACDREVLPQPERCDGVDNDCNGQIDDNCFVCRKAETRPCYPDGAKGCEKSQEQGYRCKGACKAGVQRCGDNETWGACEGAVLPKAEECKGKDDDCDGRLDNGCGVCAVGEKEPCYLGPSETRGLGECREGTRTCETDGNWGVCADQILPEPEKCDGLDNNCDGQIDEGLPTQTYHADSDKDGFGDPKKSIASCLVPKGYVDNNKDCDDQDANVFPGQTVYFDKPRKDGSFDYNCDGKDEMQYTVVGSCRDCQSAVIDLGYIGAIPSCGTAGEWLDLCRFDGGMCKEITIQKVQACR